MVKIEFKIIANILCLVVSLFLIGCSAHDSDSTLAPSELGAGNSGDAPNGNGDITAIPEKRTASILRSGRQLESLVSCLGTRAPNPTATRVWNDTKGSLSVEGSANSITSPMLVAMANIASEVCLDLINKELALSANDRRIFNRVDFSTGPVNNTPTVLEDSIRRISRSCWGRNETSAEKDSIISSTTQAFSGAANNSEQTKNQMIYLCSAMTSSFAFYEM